MNCHGRMCKTTNDQKKKCVSAQNVKKTVAINKIANDAGVSAADRVASYTLQNSADIRRATQRALNLQRQDETTGNRGDWQAAADAWKLAMDKKLARMCEAKCKS